MYVQVHESDRVGDVNLGVAKLAYYPFNDTPERFRNDRITPRGILFLSGPGYLVKRDYFCSLDCAKRVRDLEEAPDLVKLTPGQIGKIRLHDAIRGSSR